MSNPRVVIISFPIEYQRHQHHFMSLQPVIEQEREFLKQLVNRIIALRPQLVLTEKTVSGLALQFLSEANIAVAYNVKPSVLSAVSRCLETEIISSVDMLALPPNQFQTGKSTGFEVKTFINEEVPGGKKTYIFLSSNQESVHQTMFLFTDRGTPYSYRYQNTYSGHTFKFTKQDGSFKYVKLHFLSNQGNKTMTRDEAAAIGGQNPDHATEDLFNAIEDGPELEWAATCNRLLYMRSTPSYDYEVPEQMPLIVLALDGTVLFSWYEVDCCILSSGEKLNSRI